VDSSGELLLGQTIIVSAPNGQNWFARSYGSAPVNSDPYYQENLVIGDLPAGSYTIRAAYGGVSYTANVTINPGLVTYFEFRGWHGFDNAPPPGADEDYSPLVTPTPAKKP
jgi:hypothetical protein